MKLAILLAWIVGSTLTTASAAPRLQDDPEKSTERLVEMLKDLGYTAGSQATRGSEVTEPVPLRALGEEIEEEIEEVVEELAFDLETLQEEEANELFFEQTSEQRLLIGIYTQDPTELLAYHLGVDPKEAIVITNTIAGYPAAKAGLAVHDVIVGIQGQSAATLDHLRKALDNKQPGQSLTLTVVQRGQQREVQVPLFMPGAARGGSTGNVAGVQGKDIEWIIEEEEEEVREEQRYVREAQHLERLDRELRNQAMRAEMDAQRAALHARRAQLESEMAAVGLEAKNAREEVRAQLLVREAQLRAEAEAMEGALHDMEVQLERLEGELSSERRAVPRYRLSRERGGRAGALFFDDSEGEDDTMILFGGDDEEYWWKFGDEEEDEEELGEEVLDRMDDFEDRLERIEDLLTRLVERNR